MFLFGYFIRLSMVEIGAGVFIEYSSVLGYVIVRVHFYELELHSCAGESEEVPQYIRLGKQTEGRRG